MEELNICLDIKIKDTSCFPKLKNYGQMIDYCSSFDYKFESRNTYGIIGDCGCGGWSISYVSSGKDNINDGYIKINGEVVNSKILREYAWYVGDWLDEKLLFRIKYKTIYQQLRKAILKNSNCQYSLEQIIELFKLSKERLNVPIENLSWEKWNASLAIRFALGKKIFSFPWFSPMYINDLIINTNIYNSIQLLKNNGAIIIIPTGKGENIDYFIDHIIQLKSNKPFALETAKNKINKQ